METLSNFSSVYYFITFIIGAVFMLATLCIVAISKDKEPRNKVHFYVARDKDGSLWLYAGKPFRDEDKFCASTEKRVMVLSWYGFKGFGLNENDYVNLKWEDEPVEVFLNMEG